MMNIKDMKFIRRLVRPYMDWKRRKEHGKYLCSPDHFYLQTLKGIHEGKRCFIIGNGPSLRAEDLDKLKEEICFAANTIYNIFDRTDWRPTYYLSVDERTLEYIKDKLENYNLGHLFLRDDRCDLQAPTNMMTKIHITSLLFQIDTKKAFHNTSIYFSEDVSNHFCDGGTVTFEAIQLAVYMGFKEIYLLGIDHHYAASVDAEGKLIIDKTVKDHFDDTDCLATGFPAVLETAQYAFTIAKEYADNHGIEIFNATRGGKLEVFPRVDFDSLFPCK